MIVFSTVPVASILSLVPLFAAIAAFVLIVGYLVHRTNQPRFERAKGLPLEDDA